MYRLYAITVFFLLALLPVGLMAQDDDYLYFWPDSVTVVAEKDLLLPTVSAIGTKMPLPLHNTPASVGVVSRTTFEAQDGAVLSDALKNVSGVNVQHDFGTHDFFLIRGFDSLSGGLVLTDGAAEPEVSFYNLYNSERIEVLKGPSAFLYGANPLSGAVNLIRKQPVFDTFAKVSAAYGDYQTFKGRFDVGYAARDSKLAFRMPGVWHTTERYRDGNRTHTYAINPAVKYRIDAISSLTLNIEYVKSKQQPDAGMPLQAVFTNTGQQALILPEVSRTQSYQTPLDESDQDMFRFRLDYNRQLSKTVTLRDKLYFTRLDWASNGTILNGAYPNPPDFQQYSVARTFQTLDDIQKQIGNQLEVMIGFHTGAVKHNLLTGVEASVLSDDWDITIATPVPDFGLNLDLFIDLYDPRETLTRIEQLSLSTFSNGAADIYTFAPYMVNQTSLSDKLQLFYGGRFDVIDYGDTRADLNLSTGGSETSTNSQTYSRFSPMAGAVFAPLSSLSLYANAGKAFAPKSTLIRGTPDPEESVQIESGIKLQLLDGRLNSSLAFYHLEKQNIAIPDNITGAPTQNGNQRSQGFEFEISTQPRPDWLWFFNYAYTDAILTEFSEFDLRTGNIVNLTGNSPAFVPRHILNCWSSKEFNRTFGVGLGFRYVSTQFTDEDNAFRLADYLTFDGLIYFKYQNSKISLNFKNITSEKYNMRGGFGSFSVTPADPFAVYGAVALSL